MLTKIAVYCLLYPLSLLPMAILYGVAKIIYLVLYQLIRYRINVTRTNIKNS